jgi:predicted phage terminase large subunit-like protein
VNLTARQLQAQAVLASEATHVLLYGGSRSGKTFLILRAIVTRACKAIGSTHAVLRFRFNHVKASIVHDTFPKVMSLCFPQVKYRLDKTDWFAELPGGSKIWFGGLDDKERTEKILGQEHATIFLNECSQIPLSSRNLATTRLAQRVTSRVQGQPDTLLKPRMYYDCNPPSKGHWSYQLFIAKVDPERLRPLEHPEDYEAMQINPVSNAANLPDTYISSLLALPERMRIRFLAGQFGDANPNQLFRPEHIDRWRVTDGQLPDMQRIVIGVDPSGASADENRENDEIGIVAVGMGRDGRGYVLEDASLKASPEAWGKAAVDLYDRQSADLVVAEINFGGDMVRFVIQTARPRIRFNAVTASRGKVVRAEPIAALVEQGQVRLVNDMPKLEHELDGFATTGYLGEGSPNRADAMIWACHELFPGLLRREVQRADRPQYAIM